LFRGVEFHVETAGRSGGRRTVRHEYPLRDEPFVEDMGRKSRSFPVDGYVIGPEYLAARDALISALEEAGPGELVHPYYGSKRVICAEFRFRESSSDGGMVRFSIEFEETESTPAQPSAVPAAAAQVDASADELVAAIRARLAAKYQASLPNAALASASACIASAAEAMGDALAPLVAATQDLAALKRDVDNLILDADALVRQPFVVLDQFAGAIAALANPVTPPFIHGLLTACGFTPSVDRPPATTALRRAEQANYDALLAGIRATLLAQAARLAPEASYDSYDAALAVRNALTDRIDLEADGADDDGYAALLQLRADVVRAIPGEERDLPRLLSYTPQVTVPSLVLAHRLYGDLLLEQDLVTRNASERPGFIVGGTVLQVLSRA
jgi:prophage DNA circulation protein